MRPPYQPSVSGPEDTSNFDIEELRPPNNNANNASGIGSTSKDSLLNIHLPFVGFTATFTVPDQRLNQEKDQISNNHLHDQVNVDTISELNDNLTTIKLQNESSNKEERMQVLECELRTARQEWSEVTAVLGELRKEKINLSTRLRGKEEELEEQLEKISQLRQQMRNVERVKRQQLDDNIVLQSELEKERQLRKDVQSENKELEEKVSVLEKQLFTAVRTQEDQEFSQESYYLQQINNLEQQILNLQSQITNHSSGIFDNPNQQQHVKELEHQVLQLQQLQTNWERQISEIIDWVGNEKETRNYLQQMAAAMTKELEQLQQQQLLMQRYSPVQQYFGSNKQQSWQERRSARVDKQELLQLQLELQNEIEDKQRIQLELARVQRDLNNVVAELNETKNENHKLREQQSKRQSLSSTGAPTILFSSDYQNQHQQMQKIQSPAQQPIESEINSEMDSSTETSSSFDLNRTAISPQQQQHSFIIRTFVAPLKCNHCTSLMIGLIRQGLVCEGLFCFVILFNNFNPTKL